MEAATCGEAFSRQSKLSRRQHDSRVCDPQGSWGMTNRESNDPRTMNHRAAWYLLHQDLGRNRFCDFSRNRVAVDIFFLLLFFAEISDFGD